jgi:hypothetical protein
MRGVAMVYAFEDRPPATDPHVALWQRLAATALFAEMAISARPEENV